MKQKNEELGKTIKIVRVANNLSTKELAEKVNVSQAYISEIEGGNKGASLDSFKAIARALNMAPSELMKVFERYDELPDDMGELEKYQRTMITALEILIEKQKGDGAKKPEVGMEIG